MDAVIASNAVTPFVTAANFLNYVVAACRREVRVVRTLFFSTDRLNSSSLDLIRVFVAMVARFLL